MDLIGATREAQPRPVLIDAWRGRVHFLFLGSFIFLLLLYKHIWFLTQPFYLSNVIPYDRLPRYRTIVMKISSGKPIMSSLLAYITDFIQELSIYGS